MHKNLWAAAAALILAILACGPLLGPLEEGDEDFFFEEEGDFFDEPGGDFEESGDEFEESGGGFTPSGDFATDRCPFDYPNRYDIECGYLTVPETRSDPNSETIELAVAILYSDNPNKAADPLVYLSGGPGSSALYEADVWVESVFIDDRDVILIDQRGTGYSFPQLDCPEDAESGDIAPCLRRAERQGINLSSYNSAESAADLEDLRLALDIEEWNVIGVSYGTRLAMTYMRDFGDAGGIRSVILDSVYPPDINAYTLQSVNTFEALDTLFAGCAADPDCNAAYPNLAERFYTLVVDLEFEPAEFTAYDADYDEDVDFELWGYDLVNEIFQALYETPTIPYLPALIDEIDRGEYTLIGDWMLGYALGETAQSGAEGFSYPDEDFIGDSELQYYTVECYDEVAFADPDEAYRLTAGYPDVLRDLLQNDLDSLIDTCQQLDLVDTPDFEALPVLSDVPTLIVAGEYDPVTPPSWAELAEASLSNDTYAVFPGVGHAVVDGGSCPLQVMQSFLASPQNGADTSCIASMPPPDWVLP